MSSFKSLHQAALLATASLPLLVGGMSSAHAHGESIRGGGSGSVNAVGAAILEEPVIGLRWDARRYETFSSQRLVNFKKDGEDVHMHSSEDAYFLSYGFPVNEDMDINLMLQYNNFKGFKDNGDENANECFGPGTGSNINADASCVSSTTKSPGVGDLLVTGRYRFFNDGDNQWASVFSIILPTGKITNKTDSTTRNTPDARNPNADGSDNKNYAGEIIGTHNQPGSGAITFQGGIAYSGHLTEKIGLDADVIYRFATQGAKQFRQGKSWQFDLAASFAHHSSIVPVIELNGIFFDQDVEGDLVKANSGGDVIYLSPGINVKINDKQGVYANVSYPIYQELTGISNDEKYRWSMGWSSAL